MIRAPKPIVWTLLFTLATGAAAAPLPSLPSPGAVEGETLILPRRTTVLAVFTQDVVSKKKETAAGDVVLAEVYRDVEVDGKVVIAEGAELKLRVVKAQKRRMLGRKGSLTFEPISVAAVDGYEIPLEGVYMRDGRGRKVATGVLTVVFGWPFLFLHGKNAKVPAGTVFETEVYDDTPVRLPLRMAAR